MEIAATGPSSPSAAPSSGGGAGEASSAFAEVLVAFGGQAGAESASKAAPGTPPATDAKSAAASLILPQSEAAAPGTAPLADTAPLPGTVPLPGTAAEVAAPLPAGPAESAELLPPVEGADGSSVPASSAETPDAAVEAPAAPVPHPEAEKAGKPVKSAAMGGVVSETASPPLADAPAAPISDRASGLVPAPSGPTADVVEPAGETKGEAAADPQPAPDQPAVGMPAAPAAAEARSGQAAEGDADAMSLPREVAPRGDRAAAIAAGSDGAPDSAADGAPAPVVRAGQSAAPEPAALQSNAAPASPAAGQPAPQAVAALSAVGAPPSAPAAAPAPAPEAGSHPVMAFHGGKVARDMGLEIAKRVSAGGEELVIRLDPAELGRISVRMTVNEHGHLRAVVSADAPSVVDALRSDVSELSRALDQAGVRTDSQSFRFDRGGSGDPGGQWQQRYQQQNSASRQGEANGPLQPDDEPAYRRMATNGRINMMA